MPEPIKNPPPFLGVAFDQAPAAALALFRAKGLKETFAWQDMLAEEHQRAFTVAKMMEVDLLRDVAEAVQDAISKGYNAAWFHENLIPILQDAGWWGRKKRVDPLTGKEVNAQLGSAWRLNTIFRTNMQAAYAVGQWGKLQEQKQEAPWLMYDAIDDHRTRPEHAALDNLVLPVEDPFWKTHFPPNGWNCRCGTIQLSDADLKLYGLKPSKRPRIKKRKWINPRTGKARRVPVDLDPGWDYNPGDFKASLQQLNKTLLEKIMDLPADLRTAALRWFEQWRKR